MAGSVDPDGTPVGLPASKRLRRLFPCGFGLVPGTRTRVGRAGTRAAAPIEIVQPALVETAGGLAFCRHCFSPP